MFVCYRYYFLEPLREMYEDNGEPPLVAFEVPGTKRRYEVAILGRDSSIPQMLRLAVFGLPTEEIPEGALSTLQTLKEHALSILKVTDDQQTDFFPRCIWNFVPDGNPPKLKIRMSTFLTSKAFDGSAFHNLFTSSFNVRAMMKLLSEATSSTIPMNYRYLSAYRILELRFKVAGHWTSEYEELLGHYSSAFSALGLSGKSLKNYVETFRNRCAHGLFRNSNTDEPGMTSLDNDALLELEQFLPLMLELAISGINSHPDSEGFVLRTTPFSSETLRLDGPVE